MDSIYDFVETELPQIPIANHLAVGANQLRYPRMVPCIFSSMCDPSAASLGH